MRMASRSATNNTARKGLRLRPGTVVTACFLALAAIALAYVGGVMAGRASAMNQRPSVAGETQAATTRHTAAPEPVQEQAILAPAELGFVRALRSDKPLPAETAPGTTEEKVTASASSPAATDALPGAGQPSSPSAASTPAVGGTAAPLATATLHDYVFQVAAFRDEDSVDALRQRLEGHGLRTRMQREGKLYLVRVLLRGNAERATELVTLLESMRLGKPILVSRKAVVLP